MPDFTNAAEEMLAYADWVLRDAIATHIKVHGISATRGLIATEFQKRDIARISLDRLNNAHIATPL